MSVEAARAFHEKVVTDDVFRDRFRESESRGEAREFLLQAGFDFSAQHWQRFQDDLEAEHEELGQALALLHEGRTEEAERIAREARRRFPQSWQVVDILAVTLDRAGKRREAIELLRDVTPDDPCLALLAAQQQRRALDLLAMTAGYIAFPPRRGSQPQRAWEVAYNDGENGGGWSMATDPSEWPQRHHVDVRSGISRREFLEEYVYRNRPVVLAGLVDDWPAWQTWRREDLLRRHGETPIEVHRSADVIEYMQRGDRPVQCIPLAEYVATEMQAQEPQYLFKSLAGPRVEGEFSEPRIFAGETFSFAEAERQERTFFYLGCKASGLSFHQHSAAWNALIFGYKRWFLLPPLDIHFHGQKPLAEWMHTSADTESPGAVEFLQRPGEVVFVPQFWYHATYNLTDCVGIAREVGTVDGLFAKLLSATSDASV